MQSVAKQYVCAEWDYEAIENNELTFKTGDYIELVNTDNDDWWEGILNGFQGFFPANRVREVTEKETEIVNESLNSRRNTLESKHNLEIVTPATDTNYEVNYTADEPFSPESPTSFYSTDEPEPQGSPTIKYENSCGEFNMSFLVNTQLPDNWVAEYDDNTGKYYYRNLVTNETKWEFPVYNSNIEENEKDLPIGWKASYTADGQVYYYNEYTSESSWDKPKKINEIYEENKEVYPDQTENKVQITLPARKIRKSSDLQVKYESNTEKNSWKQSYGILCGNILLVYKKFTGSLSEQLPVKYVNIKNCTIPPKKKKNVVTIITTLNETITLNCSNESDANSWIDEIKRCTYDNDDDSDIIEVLEKAFAKVNIKKKTKPDKPVKNYNSDVESINNEERHKHSNSNGDEKHKSSKKFWKYKKSASQSDLLSLDYLIFGGTLEEQAQKENTTIPRIVVECITEIEKRGIDTEGIYRLSGNSAVVNRLKAQYNKGEPVSFDDDSVDLPVVASLLKLYFRELKDTLIPTSMFESFVEALRISDQNEKLTQLYQLIHSLPKVNYDTLAYLMKHLKEVSEQSDKNKMAINNLAIVFGPTLIARTTDKDAVANTIMLDMSNQNRLIDIIITYEDWFFNEDE